MSVRGSALQTNTNALDVSRSNDVLIEDSWVHGAGRYSMSVYGARNITVRRVVIRWDIASNNDTAFRGADEDYNVVYSAGDGRNYADAVPGLNTLTLGSPAAVSFRESECPTAGQPR